MIKARETLSAVVRAGVRTAFFSLTFAAFANFASAGSLLYTFGDDFTSQIANGAPTSLNSMDPASAASVTNVQTPVGNGDTGFNGGLVGIGRLIYGVGNDSNNFATLYSFQTNGQGLTAISSDFNTAGDATGFIFQNGLGAIGNTFYAIGNNGTEEALFQIGGGTATEVMVLNTFGGTYAGLAWDAGLSDFYAVIANATNSDHRGDLLVRFSIGGPVGVAANLTNLDHAVIGTHLDGLADAGGGTLYDIFIDPNTLTGQLEQITVNGGPASTATLYDTQIPLAQNAGIALVSPEPGPITEVGAGLLAVSWILLRRTRRKIAN